MSRGARAVARLLAGAPANTVNLDAPDRGAALQAALAKRPDRDQRWANLLAAEVCS
jgi:hypothetical protein